MGRGGGGGAGHQAGGASGPAGPGGQGSLSAAALESRTLERRLQEGTDSLWPLTLCQPEGGASLPDQEEPPERVFRFHHQRSKTSPIGLGVPPGGQQVAEKGSRPSPLLLLQGAWLKAHPFQGHCSGQTPGGGAASELGSC